jgi:nucleoside-triphosphatase THEP1
MDKLTNSSRMLCHITGAKGVGKTRFLQEVAQYLHARNYFSLKVQYKDMHEIKTERDFRDMLVEI